MTEPQTTNHDPDDDEISLLDLLIVLAKHKKLILGFPFIVAVLTAGITLLMSNIYTGTARIMPPQRDQSVGAALMGQLGGALGGLAGAAAGLKNPNDLYIGMLQSRTVEDDIIRRFDLNKLYDQEYQSNTRKKLEDRTTITSDNDGIITIKVDDEDPKRAAAMANAYVGELRQLTQVLAVTDASRRRLFYGRELERARNDLEKTEVATRKAIQQGGLLKVDAQGGAMVEATARLSAEIAVKQVEIGAMRAFATDRNPDLQLALQELESMKRELAKLEGTNGIKSTTPDPSGKGIENLRLLRDVKYKETMVQLLYQQYGLAKIDEGKDSTIVQVLDKAIEPDRKSKPKRALIVLLSTLAAGFVAVLWAFAREAIAKAESDPYQSQQLKAFKRYLPW